MTINSFQTDWQAFHPGSQPLAHLLHDAPGWNLTRFHLLPNNLAVARNKDELRGLLSNLDRMASVTLGDGASCWLMILGSPNENDEHRARRQRLERMYGLTPGWSFHSEEDRLTYTVSAGQVAWQPGAFHRLFLHIYQRRVWDVLFMNGETGATFHPFDAGCEVSQPTPQALVDIISAHYRWLPLNGTGFLKFNADQARTFRFEVSKPCAQAISQAINPPTG